MGTGYKAPFSNKFVYGDGVRTLTDPTPREIKGVEFVFSEDQFYYWLSSPHDLKIFVREDQIVKLEETEPRGESFECTNELKWFRHSDGRTVLHQRWIGERGTVDWREVPLEDAW